MNKRGSSWNGLGGRLSGTMFPRGVSLGTSVRRQKDMKYKIDVLCNDGSPLGVTEQSIFGLDGRNGVGGAELALLTLCRGLHDRGHKVVLYNNPSMSGGSVFQQESIDSFVPSDDRDAVIVFRSPNGRITPDTKGRIIWWSCDQYTIGDFAEFSTKVDDVVCISPHHAEYFKTFYNICDAEVIGIPVRTWEYKNIKNKKRNACIFTSVPSRGAIELLPIWSKIIEQIPDASLTITSDWSLWSGEDVSGSVSPFRMSWAGKPNVNYVGAIKRDELIKIQSEAEFHLYPCIYDELFCISVAESQVAGVFPITSTMGALETTNRFGRRISGNPMSAEFIRNFVDTTVRLMQEEKRLDISYGAEGVFGLDAALDQWTDLFERCHD